MSAKIRVCVRKRPLNNKEFHRGEKDIATVSGRLLAIDEPKVRLDMTKYIERHKFAFDEVFDADATNEDVYRKTAYPLVQYLFEGGKATCFAYGQTGSGKTYTMLDQKQGLYVLAARDIFVKLRSPENSHLGVFIGFYEIYQGQLHDLLNNRKKLHARSTNANADSSRSHAIMQLVLKNRATKSIEGKLSFIDLAGSERGADRGETDVKTRMEGAEINKSLLALKECIRALDQDKKHTPFRQSKLTQVLKDSFVGNSRTCMVATISPNNSNSEHTLNTLRYADRVKELKAEAGAKGAVQDDTEDTEGELGTTSAYDDDDYISSSSDNLLDETIDLLDDEEFPHALEQEEVALHPLAAPHPLAPHPLAPHPLAALHPLATSKYDHELVEPSPRQLRRSFDDGEVINSHRLSYNQQQQQSQRQLLQQQQQQHQQQQLQQQLQQQQLDAERFREPLPSSTNGGGRCSPQLKHATSLKTRKSDVVVSKLPMPRSMSGSCISSIPPPPRTMSPTICSPTASSPLTAAFMGHHHRHSIAGPSVIRRNSSNISPPLSGRSVTRDPRTSPDLGPSNGSTETNVTAGNSNSSSNTTSGGVARSANGTKSSHMKRASLSGLKQLVSGAGAGTATGAGTGSGADATTGSTGTGTGTGGRPASATSATQSNGDILFGLNSPTSPRVTTAAVISSQKGSNTSTTTTTTTTTAATPASAASTWSFSLQEMHDFVREHRSEMQECNDLTKRETKLLAQTGFGGDRKSFERYLSELDEIMDEKLITIVAMSQKLKALRSQM
ncbi:Kinesin-like protein kif24 [Modicella reniformis]|uniref:Kinesin-like protein n=1 Tax=Modicella reniformis TaxID=1440133 RepID=A0A9P6ST08_9FUNG|nr:Kinesin-like protein kif24 [Modicella reniformis]